ncbi:hypothetical protein AGMMS50268_00970 [Spirochaetia bacterium]|nr:hypothetical protein AGMMS50268_00970 [Spirochaetia bacterium]
MRKLMMLLAAFSVVALTFIGCATTGVVANSEGYDIKNSSGDKPVQPSWIKNPEVRDAENMKFFRIKGPSSEYTKLDAAMANLDELAQRRISEYIDKTIKIKDKDLQWTTTENGNISGGENVTSFIEAYTDVKLRGISMERHYWELAKGKELYYTGWGEYSIPNDAIEDARKFIAEKESAENYMARKTAEDNKRFDVLRNDFSREIEPFFKDASRKELFFADRQKYQTRYSHLMEIKAQLVSLGSLQEQTVYKDFVFKIKEMVEAYEPTEMLVMSNQEQIDQLRLEYEKKIAGLDKGNNALKDEYEKKITGLNEGNNALKDEYETKIARLDERNNALKDKKDEVFALFNNLSRKFEQQQNDDLRRLDWYLDIITSWPVPSRQQLATAETYQVKRGDTLVKIARQRYGSGLYFPWVAKCNPNLISNVDLIRVGTTLCLPDPTGSLNLATMAQSAAR